MMMLCRPNPLDNNKTFGKEMLDKLIVGKPWESSETSGDIYTNGHT